MSNPFSIVELEVDYYAALGVDRSSLRRGGNKADREHNAKILDKAWREKARYAHPDFPGDSDREPGSADKFKALLRAHTVLSDPIRRAYYDSGGKDKPALSEDGFNFEVDWSKIGSYRPDTPAATFGNNLFLSICSKAEDLGLIPAFRPETEYDNYEWDFVVKGTKSKIALSLVYSEDDVLRLTGMNAVSYSLPFKLYFCVPRKHLSFARSSDTVVKMKDGTSQVVKGSLLKTAYSDIDLFETTDVKAAYAYVAGRLSTDIEKIRSGEMLRDQAEKDRRVMDGYEMHDTPKASQYDLESLKSVFKSSQFNLVENENAADFLDDI